MTDTRQGGELHTPRPDDTYAVRPYALTGGRTAPSGAQLPMEALVQGLVGAERALTPECRTILELTADQYLSIAELSAHTRLPVGVVRVLVSDLVEQSMVRVHGLTMHAQRGNVADDPAATLSVLESVLNGITSL